MLEPRESDIPALFLVFVVVPIITYFLLGKWSETPKRKERICLVSRGATEEALRVDDMAVGSISPVIHLPNGIRQCARCFAAAATRCSQCKAVWYCSGRCQIVHWRQVHKLECQQLGKDFQRASLKRGPSEGSREQCSFNETAMLLAGLRDSSRTADGAVFNSPEEVSGSGFTLLDSALPPEDSYLREGDFSVSEMHANIHDDLRGALHESDVVERASLDACDGGNSFVILSSSTTAVNGTNAYETRTALRKDHSSQKRTSSSDETKGSICSSERANKRSSKSRITSQSNGTELHKNPKSRMKVSKEPLSSDVDIKVQAAKESRIATLKDDIALQENNRVANQGLMRMVDMPKSTKVDHYLQIEDSTVKKRKVKMIFPYEEFVKCFQYEFFNMIPRGLVNCGNSCYANAVLQCLACTKPLIIYLLRHSHSRAGCAKDWCLLCELEQLVMMLRQSGGPLSPVNILMYIRSLNTQIGDGSQEDAHEFLRLLVASMQSICLEGFGGEKAVDPRLQDTTFIQHTFGGCLRSKVKCSRCHHVSERDEKMMDLTLEIYGWVESLEDALTQFTSSEDLDGDNMYRCARCAAYVRARKQLNIKEAPNILTIVLKRFQEGNYGKINKCITFPEMLDMIPFMTGTDDIPPLYMLYAVVVHLDTSNASFSGHYISYVKDLQGNWFRVDDTEVQPVELSHVMSERAYILFYMRSYPRPVRFPNGRPSRHQTNPQKPLKPEESPNVIQREPNSNHMLEENLDPTRGILLRENITRPSSSKNYAEFSDATSSDWSHFTSSDDSSFTTESTRDSFSTDVPFPSIFQSLYPAETGSRRTISCSEALTRFAREERGLRNVNYGGEPRNGQPQSCVDCTI